jgi:hypothetical protein
MDKKGWSEIASNDYAIPEGHTLPELTQQLFSYLGSTDPELRDEIAYVVYANWLKREMFSADEIRGYIRQLLANLEIGIGETGTDTIFLRSFSALLLAETVHNDNKRQFLSKDEVQYILERGLMYLSAEKDPRGYVPVKGWAHALAHTADLMLVLGRNRNLEAADLMRILEAVSEKMVNSTSHLYVHGEDERLANAIIEITRRGLIPVDAFREWNKSLLEPKDNNWKDAHMDEDRNRAFQNTRNLLRSIYLTLVSVKAKIPDHAKLEKTFLEAVQNLSAF